MSAFECICPLSIVLPDITASCCTVWWPGGRKSYCVCWWSRIETAVCHWTHSSVSMYTGMCDIGTSPYKTQRIFQYARSNYRVNNGHIQLKVIHHDMDRFEETCHVSHGADFRNQICFPDIQSQTQTTLSVQPGATACLLQRHSLSNVTTAFSNEPLWWCFEYEQG